MSIQHLVRGGRESNREARVDKIETDKFNSIVERIAGVNPSKLAAIVTKDKVSEDPIVESPSMPSSAYGAGPAHDLRAARQDPQVAFLANKVAILEAKLAQHETFDGQDNDVVMTSKRLVGGQRNRGPESSVFARDVDSKKAKSKDPVDGKPDKPTTKKQPEAQMAGEQVNVLGISMNEWREMAGIKAPPADLTIRRPMAEAIEDEVDGQDYPEEHVMDEAEIEHALWTIFLEANSSNPADFAAFVDEADEVGDEEALIAVQDMEDEFVEALSYYMEGNEVQKQEVIDYLANGGSDYVQELPEEAASIDELWGEWLEGQGLTAEAFDALVESAETDDDIGMLQELQAMFEADIVGKRIAGVGASPGDADLATDQGVLKMKSLAHGQVKPSRKQVFSVPLAIRKQQADAEIKKMRGEGIEDDFDDEAFECDSDGEGGPDMKNPGWAKAMKKFKMNHKGNGRRK